MVRECKRTAVLRSGSQPPDLSRLEQKVSIAAEHPARTHQRGRLFGVVDEHLGHVPGHRDGVDRDVRECRRVVEHPGDEVCACLA